jgi:hypothetical protein
VSDDLIVEAFERFTAGAGPSVRPPGTPPIRARAARHRRVRAVAASFVGVLLLAVPAAIYAASGPDDRARPPADGPSVTASVSPSVSATDGSAIEGPPTPPPPGPRVRGTGPITVEGLAAGAVPVPQWIAGQPDYFWEHACPSGPAQAVFSIRSDAYPNILVQEIAYANLDNDPDLEAAALLKCVGASEADGGQVVVYDRDAEGWIVSLGQIVSGTIWHVTANPKGGVDVELSDIQACCDTPKVMEIHQLRTYGFNGARFVQTGGPTSFTTHTKSIDLKLSLQTVTWGPVTADASGGKYHEATLTLRVTNAGPVTSNPFVVMGDYFVPDHTLEPLRAGTSRTMTIVLGVDINASSLVLRVDELGGVADANPDNNSAVIPNPTT